MHNYYYFKIYLNRILGQLQGVDKMFLDNKNHPEILQQLEAIKGAISSLEKKIIYDYLTDSQFKKLESTINYLLKIKN